MPEKGRYLVGQKLSDYQFEKILKCFAHGVPAKDALEQLASGGKRSRAPNTVYRIYDLIRKRLLELGYFPEPAEYIKWTRSTEELRENYVYSSTWLRIQQQSERLRGASDESGRYVLAEIIFRAENPMLTPDALYLDIRTAIRLTGPLNRPARDVDLWYERHNITVYRRQMAQLRTLKRYSKDGLRSLIADYEELIAEANKRLRKKMRDRTAAIASPPKSDD